MLVKASYEEVNYLQQNDEYKDKYQKLEMMNYMKNRKAEQGKSKTMLRKGSEVLLYWDCEIHADQKVQVEYLKQLDENDVDTPYIKNRSVYSRYNVFGREVCGYITEFIDGKVKVMREGPTKEYETNACSTNQTCRQNFKESMRKLWVTTNYFS